MSREQHEPWVRDGVAERHHHEIFGDASGASSPMAPRKSATGRLIVAGWVAVGNPNLLVFQQRAKLLQVQR